MRAAISRLSARYARPGTTFEQSQRRLLTEDKDFGWLAFVAGAQSHGVVLIRFPGTARRRLAEVLEELVALHGAKLESCFTVVEPGHIRMTPRPA